MSRDAGNVFPATDFKGNHLVAMPACITARAVMHVGIANPRWRGNRSRHSRRMRNPQFYVSFGGGGGLVRGGGGVGGGGGVVEGGGGCECMNECICI